MIARTVSSPDWIVQESPWQPERNQAWESVLTVGNGYLGVRGFPEEPFDAGPTRPAICLAGVFDQVADGVPDLACIANFLAVKILLGGRSFRMAPGRVTEYRRTLDLRRGLLQRALVYQDRGRSTRIEFERFASMANRHLVGQMISLTPLDDQRAVRPPQGKSSKRLRLNDSFCGST